MGESEPGRRMASALLRLLGMMLRLAIGGAVLLREFAAWAGGPIWRLLSRIQLLKRLSNWVAGLPRWGVLLALAAPLVVAEPLKVAGLYALAIGQVFWGVALQGVGHGLSLLLVERIIDAGRLQLMSYRWFAIGYGWFERIRAAALAWPPVVAARLWARRMAASARLLAAEVRARLLGPARL